jgi:DNA-binding NtrC family response regulator
LTHRQAYVGTFCILKPDFPQGKPNLGCFRVLWPLAGVAQSMPHKLQGGIMMGQRKVLVVDDDENILSAFRDFLRGEGCHMIAASSSEEAMRKIEQQHLDLLITDIKLKNESGITFFMRVKAIRPNLPVIVITGYPDLISEQDVRAYGADFFFLKPLELHKLREAVTKCLCLNLVSSYSQ